MATFKTFILREEKYTVGFTVGKNLYQGNVSVAPSLKQHSARQDGDGK